MNKQKKRIFIASLIVLILIAGGVLFYLNIETSTETIGSEIIKSEITINVGSVAVMETVVLEIAKQNNYFKEQGLNVNIIYAKSTSYLLPALATGELDVSLASIAAGTLNYLAGNKDVRIIVEAAKRKPAIVVRKDLADDIKVIEDLKGKRFATPRTGSASYYFLIKILKQTELSIEDIKTQTLKTKEVLFALQSKDLDAAIINEPYATLAVEKELGVFMQDSRIHAAFPEQGQEHSFLIANKRLFENEDLLEKFRRAYTKAAVFYNKARSGSETERARVVEIVSNYTGLNENVVEKSNWIYINDDAKPDEQQLEEIQDCWVESGLVESKVDIGYIMV